MAGKLISRTLLVLICAQFIITIDTTFMNVSLSTLVKDLNTTVTGVQSAISLYALVMAALMIPGAKFGDIIGRKRAFIIGLIIYAAGTLITSLSPNLPIFIFGWSLLEGIGAAIMLPAMMSLIADNFAAGPPRAKAYSAFAASAGVAAAVGPIIGGLFTTYLSWRLAFGSELIIAIFIYSQRNIINEQVLTGQSPKFDWIGFVLSAFGLVTLVEGIILASGYGIIKCRKDFLIAGHTVLSAGGISPTVILVLIGSGILAVFYGVESRRFKDGKSTLLDVRLLKRKVIWAGSTTLMMQALILTGVIFSLSLYVQMELNYSAIKSGITLLPLSFGVLIFAGLAGRVFAKKYAPRFLMFWGFVLILLGVIAMGISARNATSGADFAIGLALIGSGIGIVVSQNQNLMISSVSAKNTNETAGIINTFQNTGSSMGTSLAGAVMLAIFVSVATTQVNNSTTFNTSQKSSLNMAIVNNAQIVSNQQLTNATDKLPKADQTAILNINQDARQRALTVVYFVLGAVGFIGLLAVTRLPKVEPLAKAQVG